MSMTNLPAMLVSETTGWADIDHAHHSQRWFLTRLVLPLSLLPPLLYVYAESTAPGAIFPLSVPALTMTQLIVSALVFYCAEVAMVGYMAMLVRRTALARDHDPGEDGAYALAAIAFTPFWLASLALVVPSLSFNLAMMTLAGIASIVLIRHGVRPLLHIPDARNAHYIADMVTLAGVVAWIGLMLVTALLLSMLLVHWTIG